MLDQIISGTAEGLIWAILALGVYITYRVLDFADLSVDGTLATGGCVAAILITGCNFHPLVALLIAFLAGGIAGVVTGLLHTKLKIPAILSGILTMSALYSINKRILGDASLNIHENKTLFGRIAVMFNIDSIEFLDPISIGVTLLFLGLIVAFMYWFFGTEQGCAIRATGNNQLMATAQGVNTDRSKIIALGLSNGLAALSGAMLSQYTINASVDMATGTVVIGLASIILGELIFGKKLSFWLKLLGIVVGSVLYRLIIVFAIMLGMHPDDLKLIATLIIIIALCVPRVKDLIMSKKKNKEDAQNA